MNIWRSRTGLKEGPAFSLITLLYLALSSLPVQASQSVDLISYNDHCGGISVVITDADRFDPLVQQLMTERQLDRHPVLDKPVFMVLPAGNDQRLTERQIRYLERLLSE